MWDEIHREILTFKARRTVVASGVAVLLLGLGLLITPWMGKQGLVSNVQAYAYTVSLARDLAVWVAALAVCGVYGAVVTRLGRRWISLALSAFGLAALFRLGYVVMTVSYGHVPELWDVQTDWKEPVGFSYRLEDKRAAAPPANPGDDKLQAQAYAKLKPFVLQAEPTLVYHIGMQALRNLDMRIVADYRTEKQMEAVSVSGWFGLERDIAVRVTGEDGIEHTIIDMRCAARYGLGDPQACVQILADIREEMRVRLRDYQKIAAKIEARKLKPLSELGK